MDLAPWRFAVVVLWLGGVLAGSLLHGEAKTVLGTNGAWHRAIHLLVFAATVVVVGRCLQPLVGKWQAAGVAFGLGVLCEVMQRVIYIPVMEWMDIVDDGAGALLGWMVLRWMHRWTHRFGEWG